VQAPEGGTCHAAGQEQPCQREPEPESSSVPKPSKAGREKPSHGSFYGLPIQQLVLGLFRQCRSRLLGRRHVRRAGSAGSQVQVEIPVLRRRQGSAQRHVHGLFRMQARIHRNTPTVSGE
jgi:hypothetical protein